MLYLPVPFLEFVKVSAKLSNLCTEGGKKLPILRSL